MTSTRHSLSVVHVVVTDAFAGVERYVVEVAGALAARGHRVHTIGGDPVRMRAELPDTVSVHRARTLVAAARAVASTRDVDLVHVHMTTAEGAAWLARPLPPGPRSSPPATSPPTVDRVRWLGPWLR